MFMLYIKENAQFTHSNLHKNETETVSFITVKVKPF